MRMRLKKGIDRRREKEKEREETEEKIEGSM